MVLSSVLAVASLLNASPVQAVTVGCPSSLPGPSALRVGELGLDATFNSIGVELPFGGDGNGNSSAELSYRTGGTSEWREALPLWLTNDCPSAHGPAYFGSILLLEPGTTYDVRVKLSDPDGVEGSTSVQATIKTRPDNLKAATALQPNYYVRANGDDDRDGRSASSAWRTLQRVMRDAPSGAVVQIGPGYYQAPTAIRRSPLTLVAQYPAVDDERRVINSGKHAVIEPSGLTSPAGAAGQPNAGVWKRVTLEGPKTGRSFTVWRWANSSAEAAGQLGYAESRAGLPSRVAHWQSGDAATSSPAAWAETLYTNRTYNYGFYADERDIYLRLPGDANPNDFYITAHGNNDEASALDLDGANIRVSGLEIRKFETGVSFGPNAEGGVVDHLLLFGNRSGVRFNGLKGSPPRYGSGHLVERSLIADEGLWSTDSDQPAIAWKFIKTRLKKSDGTLTAGRLGRRSETVAVSGQGGAHQVVVRHNTIDGTFDGVSPGVQSGFDRDAGRSMDVHDNLFRHIPDDALEPERQAINLRAWQNRFENLSVVLSTAPINYGPLYLFRNEAWRVGVDGVGKDSAGSAGLSPTFFKYSGSSKPAARVYVLHNTFWSDRPNVTGGAQFGGSGSAREQFDLRNNLIRATRYAFEAPPDKAWSEDYNHFATSDSARGLNYMGKRYTTNVSDYRQASGEGTSTNVAGNFVSGLDGRLVDPQAGDLRLRDGSDFVDAGDQIPNLSDRKGANYSGTAPDLGANER